jgi:two-component system NarL family response regulator
MTERNDEQGTIKVLIADDHAIIRAGLVAILSEDGVEIVGQASTADDAIAQHAKHAPDIILLDLQMPGRDCVETISAIRTATPDARIIALSDVDGDAIIAAALSAGAASYLLKSVDAELLLRAIHDVNAGKRCIPPEIGAKLADRASDQPLTPRELDVLEHLSKGMSNKEIAGELSVSEGTVKTHMNSIMAKLRVGSRTEAVTVALDRGLIALSG